MTVRSATQEEEEEERPDGEAGTAPVAAAPRGGGEAKSPARSLEIVAVPAARGGGGREGGSRGLEVGGERDWIGEMRLLPTAAPTVSLVSGRWRAPSAWRGWDGPNYK